MRNLLKSEYLKFKSSYALWIIIAVITASCGISVITGTYQSADQALINIEKDCMVPILASAIYGAIILCEDFSNGIVRCYISAGYKRAAIVRAKIIHYILGCIIILFLYPFFSILLALAVLGTETSVAVLLFNFISDFFKTLPLYLGILGLFFLLAFIIKKGVLDAGTSFAVAILSVVFSNKFYPSLPILKYSPIIQINSVLTMGASTAYYVAVVVSLIMLLISLLISLEKFKRDEIL